MVVAPPPATPSAPSPFAIPRPLPRAEEPDGRVLLHGMTWKDYEILLAVRGDRAGVRLSYLDGTIEIMSPSHSHEHIKKTLARLVEACCDERALDLTGIGSWTLKNAPEERGVEPDECYIVGAADKPVPDFALEVIWTHGGLDKLEIYRPLGVHEVWVWDRAEGLRIYGYTGSAWEVRPRSRFLPDLDPAWLSTFLDEPNQSAAVRGMRASLRAATGAGQ